MVIASANRPEPSRASDAVLRKTAWGTKLWLKKEKKMKKRKKKKTPVPKRKVRQKKKKKQTTPPPQPPHPTQKPKKKKTKKKKKKKKKKKSRHSTLGMRRAASTAPLPCTRVYRCCRTVPRRNIWCQRFKQRVRWRPRNGIPKKVNCREHNLRRAVSTIHRTNTRVCLFGYQCQYCQIREAKQTNTQTIYMKKYIQNR
jgi:hypothetical protein